MIAVTDFHKLVKSLEKHKSITAVMTAGEVAKGYIPINCDDKPWYPSAEWHNGCISTDGKNVRILAIMAKYPGTGSFTRMIKGIKADGMRPVVIQPFRTLTKILQLWGWKCRKVGEGWDAEFQWAETWRGQL